MRGGNMATAGLCALILFLGAQHGSAEEPAASGVAPGAWRSVDRPATSPRSDPRLANQPTQPLGNPTARPAPYTTPGGVDQNFRNPTSIEARLAGQEARISELEALVKELQQRLASHTHSYEYVGDSGGCVNVTSFMQNSRNYGDQLICFKNPRASSKVTARTSPTNP